MSLIRRPSRRGGVISKLVYVGLAALVVFLYVNRNTNPTPSPKDVAKGQQQDPESALRYYLTTAYHFIHQENGGSYDDVRQTVRKEDWDWYQAHYNELFDDPFNISGGIDPTSADAIAHRSALQSLFESGPNRPDAQITNETLGPTEATFRVKYLVGVDTYDERVVHVVFEGGLWRVANFAGARRP